MDGKAMNRLLDVIVAVVGIVFTAPLGLAIAVLIKVDSSGSVLYTQRMAGQHGTPFTLFRFRTMDANRSDLPAEQRLTPVGHWIRHYSLDHLPMLFNLLRGDLTLVGPRPMEVAVVNVQEPLWQQYFAAKPGLVNYAVLKLGKQWNQSRRTRPLLNQQLEVTYAHRRSTVSDLRLLIHYVRKLVMSRGNVKARAEVDPDLEG
jgi:lipopolysaccharide/colanic/teichoic acid biosynthesis glycosyltransferase